MEQWNAVGAHCSSNERRADEASRDVEAWLKCRYMREHLVPWGVSGNARPPRGTVVMSLDLTALKLRELSGEF